MGTSGKDAPINFICIRAMKSCLIPRCSGFINGEKLFYPFKNERNVGMASLSAYVSSLTRFAEADFILLIFHNSMNMEILSRDCRLP